VETAPLETLTLVKPVESLETLGRVYQTLLGETWTTVRWLVPVALLVWVTVGAVGQNAVMKRMATKAKGHFAAVWWVRLWRAQRVFAFWCLWIELLGFGARVMITRPAASGAEPSAMGFVAIAIVGSLVLFVLWAAVSWPTTLAQVIAVKQGWGFRASLVRAWSMKEVRAQLLEGNLVFCIVKLILVVLAMTFSACPLPFEQVATPAFMAVWTSVVLVWYCVMSDLFHVVRMGAYVSLYETDEEMRRMSVSSSTPA